MKMVVLSLQINDMEKLMIKPTIIAICGKSAAGKDTLKYDLEEVLFRNSILINIILSDTTRPPRVNEIQGEDYNFIPEREFLANISKQRYIEYSRFRNWYYGTQKIAIQEDKVNIGVFNREGIKSLSQLSYNYNVIVVYLKINFKERMRRSCYREGRFRIEFLRRALTDF